MAGEQAMGDALGQCIEHLIAGSGRWLSVGTHIGEGWEWTVVGIGRRDR